jgi:glycosyltransferase involved in cell wall biosynthesis
MAFGNCVITHSTPENLETIGDAGLAYEGKVGAASLRQVLRELLSAPERIEAYRAAAFERARKHFSWEAVTDAYEALFYRVRRR